MLSRGRLITGLRTLVYSLGVITLSAQAYPTFIGYGYTSCLVCHFNAYGGGQLTDYGRALSATTIAAKPFWNSKAADDELAEQSGFLGSVTIPRWLHPDASYRGLLLTSQIQGTSSTQWINMKADVSVTVKPSEFYWFTGNLGYLPPSPGGGGSQSSRPSYISREHYVAVQPMRSLRTYVGFTDVIYGIKIPDHTAFSRQLTLLQQNDQTHGVILHYGTKTYDAGVQYFLGNLFQTSSTRLKGGAGSFEFDIAEKARMGFSAYYGTSDFRNRLMACWTTRIGAGEGSAFITELGGVRETIVGNPRTLGSYLLFQSLSRLLRGLNFMVTAEYYSKDTFAPNARVFRVSPGLNYFPFQRLELRVDLQSTRVMGGPSVSPDNLDLLSQVHLWF